MFALLMGLKTVSPEALHQLVQGNGATVLDVNSRQSWLKARVPGARNLDPVEYSDRDLPPAKDSVLVFYCSNPLCRKAPNAARQEDGVQRCPRHVCGHRWLAQCEASDGSWRVVSAAGAK